MVRFIIYLPDLHITYSVACNTVAECSLPLVQCVRVTRFVCYSATPAAAEATATTHNLGIYCCCWHRLLFLLLPLCYFCPCHAVAYLAVPVVAKHAETNVKYPAYTDPPDHTEILQTIQILQIVQTASQLRCTDHSNHTDSTQADHTDPADYTDPGDR